MSDINKILELIASSESTDKLREYWLGQFQSIVNNEFITLDSSLIDALSKPEVQADKPMAPVAMLNTLKHLDASGEIDDISLQSTVETMLRLLDDAIDALNLSPQARTTIELYRRVAMGIYNFDEYLSQKNATSSEEEIDKIASAFSNAAYRSSEALAEEKGVCAIWNDMKLSIKPRMFEYWYNTENGEIYNGYEVSQMYTQETIVGSNMEIIPRRNATLLAFGIEEGWRDWSDRDPGIVKINSNVDSKQGMTDNNLPKNSTPLTPTFVPQLDPELNIKPEVEIESIPLENVLPEIMNSFPAKSFFSPTKGQEGSFEEAKISEELSKPAEKQSLSKTLLDKSTPKFENNLLLDNLENEPNDNSLISFDTTSQNKTFDTEPALAIDLETFDLPTKKSLFKTESKNESKIDFKADSKEEKEELKQEPKKESSKSQRAAESDSLAENKKDILNIINPFAKKSSNNSSSKTENISNENIQKTSSTKSELTDSTINFHSTMSQFTIALQQIISTPEFNQILISAQYDASGLKMISVSGEKLNGELSSLVRTYIGLVNMSLAKGITASDIAEELTEDLDASSPAATRVLSMIANALKEFPNRINEIKADTLAPLDLKTIREAGKTKRNVLEILG